MLWEDIFPVFQPQYHGHNLLAIILEPKPVISRGVSPYKLLDNNVIEILIVLPTIVNQELALKLPLVQIVLQVALLDNMLAQMVTGADLQSEQLQLQLHANIS